MSDNWKAIIAMIQSIPGKNTDNYQSLISDSLKYYNDTQKSQSKSKTSLDVWKSSITKTTLQTISAMYDFHIILISTTRNPERLSPIVVGKTPPEYFIIIFEDNQQFYQVCQSHMYRKPQRVFTTIPSGIQVRLSQSKLKTLKRIIPKE